MQGGQALLHVLRTSGGTEHDAQDRVAKDYGEILEASFKMEGDHAFYRGKIDTPKVGSRGSWYILHVALSLAGLCGEKSGDSS